MKPNYTVSNVSILTNPLLIQVCNYKHINLIENYAWQLGFKPTKYTIGVWKIKYK